MPSARTQIFHGPHQPFRSAEVELPDELQVGEVLVKLTLASICGSDLHTIHGQRTEKTPCILGHEGVGRIIGMGGGRGGLSIGDRVTWTIADSCGDCVFCSEYGLPEKCLNLFKYGHADLQNGTGLNGCYASHILLRSGTGIVRVPDTIPDELMAPVNCALATIVNATSKLPDSIRSIVIQGAGMLGLYACAVMHQRGLTKVFCVDVNADRLKLVPYFGVSPWMQTTRCPAGLKV